MAAPVPTLLTQLHAIVMAGGPSGLHGVIGVGVRDGGTTRWWQARFAAQIDARLDTVRPDDATACIVMGQRSAAAVLKGQAPMASDVDVSGDSAFVARFLSRYGSGTHAWNTLGFARSGLG